MTIGSVNYPSPVRVNGYACKNCSEVDLAAQHIDPAHPRSGPDNRDAISDPTRQSVDPVRLAAVRKTAEAAGDQVIGYSRTGYRTPAIAPGTGFALAA